MINRLGATIREDIDIFTLGHLAAPAAPPGTTFADYPVSEKFNSLREDLGKIIQAAERGMAMSKDQREVLNAARKIVTVNRHCLYGDGYTDLNGNSSPPHVDDYYFVCLLIDEWNRRFEKVDGRWRPREVQVARYEI